MIKLIYIFLILCLFSSYSFSDEFSYYEDQNPASLSVSVSQSGDLVATWQPDISPFNICKFELLKNGQSFGALFNAEITSYVDTDYVDGDSYSLKYHGCLNHRHSGSQADIVPSVSGVTKVAFIGDMGTYDPADDVLSLIVQESTDLVVIQGDLGYDKSAAEWNQNVMDHLGSDIPTVITIGDHDDDVWQDYVPILQSYLSSHPSLSCVGEIGVRANCIYENIHIVQTAPGFGVIEGVTVTDTNYAQYITDSFATSTSDWKICSFHKNQTLMQTGSKPDEAGWDVYQACLQAGAIVVTGNEHAYSRTYLMSSFENQIVDNTSSDMNIEPGKSIAIVSGLGGWQARDQVRNDPWWAKIYTNDQGALAGALFCEFSANSADCYFKDVNGNDPDFFTLTNN